MSNPLKKTMVYLGLADEELEHEAPQAPAPRRARRARRAGAAPHRDRAPVTPLRKNHVQPSTPQAEMNEILTVHPRQYRDAQVIAESFREGVPVIINLSQMSRRRRPSSHRLRQRPLAGPLRQDRARDEQGLPALARARRGLAARPAKPRATSTRRSSRTRSRRGRTARRLEHPLRAAPHLLLRDVGAVRARSRAHVQPVVATARRRGSSSSRPSTASPIRSCASSGGSFRRYASARSHSISGGAWPCSSSSSP